MEELERVTTKQAAVELHMSILTLQTLMQQGLLPWKNVLTWQVAVL